MMQIRVLPLELVKFEEPFKAVNGTISCPTCVTTDMLQFDTSGNLTVSNNKVITTGQSVHFDGAKFKLSNCKTGDIVKADENGNIECQPDIKYSIHCGDRAWGNHETPFIASTADVIGLCLALGISAFIGAKLAFK